eukprot:177556-Alexandrium_andersonii.AAC.1
MCIRDRCDACSYALRFKRYLSETEAPDDMPEAYARHLEQQREDARAMEALNQVNRSKRGILPKQ